MKEPKLGHYVPRMIEEWRRLEKRVKSRPPTTTGDLIINSCDLLLDTLDKAVCFTIGESAFPLVWQTDLSEIDLEGQRLPFPVMAIEYNFDYEFLKVSKEKMDSINDPAFSRIILLVEISDTQFALMSAYRLHNVPERVDIEWAMGAASMVFDYEMLENMDNWYKVDKETNSLSLAMGGPGEPKVTASLPMFEETVNNLPDHEAEHLVKDMADEMRMAFGMLGILSCDNAPIEKIAPPAKLNKKRVKSGKSPIPTYRTLHVTDHTRRGTGGATGTHASPRAHWRRGHIRNQPTAKGVIRKWIKPTIIGGADAPKPEVVIT